jgi:hypothetical protein
MLNYECDPSAVFDDKNLPSGVCDDIGNYIGPCASNIATGWAVGGDYVSFGCRGKKFFINTTHYFRIDC